MITLENFPKLLRALHFREKNNVFIKEFASGFILKVDFNQQELIYPELQGLRVHQRHICDFEANENFVVFECVHRLLEKGYLPKDIELEPRWKVGHGAGGGRADILVKKQDGKPLLLIECKTAGYEFNRAWKYTLQDGGQLFTYAQQMQEIEFLCLYASDFDEKTQQIKIEQKIIAHKDNPKILVETKGAKSFEKAKDVKERYQVWKDTYKLEYTEVGIFEHNIPPYSIGKETYTTADLVVLNEEDIQKKYNEYAEILRKHNISGRENAFDKLVNLFLAKIVDEKHNPSNLQFRWKGIAADNFFDFIDRLESLYARGMQEFLHEEVVFVEKQMIIDAFKMFKNDPDATRQTVLEHFKRQKYFTNSNFSFIDVHNEKLFYQNFAVLKEVVEMIQNIKLNGEQENQFLGDLFEGFLDRGIKQTEGQFFTPLPIVKFILHSLPLEELLKKQNFAPKVIDYACGAGHFLTEMASQLKEISQQLKTGIQEEHYYRNLYGIEKEYRLSKVAKVSAFMYNQDEIQIFYADALVKHPEIRDGSFDILISNPPFAVKGFLETLTEKQREEFELSKLVSDLYKNNQIQCFFLERAKQLLKTEGIAAIIVPTSVLSNSDNLHIATREMILKFFDIIALVELGGGTFSKTGTNTVVLFLRKKEDNPPLQEYYKFRTNICFSDQYDEEQIYDDKYIIRRYCENLDIKFEDYLLLLKATDDLTPIQNLLQYNLFKEYERVFEAKRKPEIIKKQQKELENLPKEIQRRLKKENQKLTNDKLEQVIQAEVEKLQQQHQRDLRRAFIRYVKEIEKEKLYYFSLALSNPQKVLIVRSPAETNERKKFLGYEWSSAKGSEGIKYLGATYQTVEIEAADDEDMRVLQNIVARRVLNTPLFDSINRQNPDKISYYIQKNFALKKRYTYIPQEDIHIRDFFNEKTEPLDLPEHLQQYATYANVYDLLDFTRTEFNKAFSLTPKKSTLIDTQWSMVKLGEIAQIQKGDSITEKETEKGDVKVVAGGVDFAYYHNRANRPANTITVSASGVNAGFVNFWKEPIFASDCITIRGKTDTETIYIFNLLKCLLQKEIFKLSRGAAQPHVYLHDIANINIPLPPEDIQKRIVESCQFVDAEVDLAKKEIEKLRREIEEKFTSLYNAATERMSLTDSDSFEIFIGKRVLQADIEGKTKDQGIPVFSANVFEPFGYIDKYLIDDFSVPSVIWGIDGDWMVNFIPENVPFYPTDHCGVLRIKTPKLNYRYVAWALNKIGKDLRFSRNLRASIDRIKSISIPVPPSDLQRELVTQAEELEKQIEHLKQRIARAPEEKKSILRRYL
ncbi:MAG: restriction endonuclease subunit S [Cytophagales bacterium]|nr:restriction endonuclease subunit S [Bernardetiaceae bacterium]MDW8211019.1 restriction endonuclease subunit S [Cytophagales bacterium]